MQRREKGRGEAHTDMWYPEETEATGGNARVRGRSRGGRRKERDG